MPCSYLPNVQSTYIRHNATSLPQSPDSISRIGTVGLGIRSMYIYIYIYILVVGIDYFRSLQLRCQYHKPRIWIDYHANCKGPNEMLTTASHDRTYMRSRRAIHIKEKPRDSGSFAHSALQNTHKLCNM